LARGDSLRVGLYARVSTRNQQTLPMQLAVMRQYARRRGWRVAFETKEVGSGAKTRPARVADGYEFDRPKAV
jgi:DNA invertase Pin-like site-specific DNA recombinase